MVLSGLGGLAVCAAGAVALTAAAFYFMRQRRDAVGEDSVQNTSSGSPHSSDNTKDLQMDRPASEDAVSSVEMNMKESSYVLELENRVAELEKQLCDIHVESEVKRKECEQKQQAHYILKEKYDELEKEKEDLLKELERARQKYSVLLSQSNDAKDSLENEKMKLRDEVQTLRGSVENLEEELSETRRVFAEKTADYEEEQMIYRMLKEKYDEMEKEIKEKEELLNGHKSKLKDQEERKISLNNKLNELIRESELKRRELERWRHENSVLLSQCNEAKTTLENENIKLRDEIQTLQGSVQSLEEELSGTCRMNEEKMRGTLENENIKLREEVQTLRGSVENLKEELCETRRMCEEIMRDNEEEQMAHRILKEKYDEMEKEMNEKEKLINDHESKLKDQEDKEISLNNKLHLFIREFELKSEELERSQQEYSVLLSQYKNTEMALADAVKSTQTAVRSNAQLEHMNSIFQQQIHEANLVYDNIMCDREELHRDYSLLWSRYEDIKNALCNSEWMTEQTLQANQELDHEKSVIMEKVETLESLVDKLQKRLSNIHKKQVKLFKSTLENENKLLKDEVKTLQSSVKSLQEKILEVCAMCKEKMKGFQQEKQDPSIPMEKSDVLQQEVKEKEELHTQSIPDLQGSMEILHGRLPETVMCEEKLKELEQEQQNNLVSLPPLNAKKTRKRRRYNERDTRIKDCVLGT